ncbi:MAG: glycerol kinase GlpK [Clostridiales bacterium]|nr:glycerol kinase GlpK [Clostridiales bacterium]
MKYIVGIDQSTQGTKAVLFDESGRLIGRADRKHRQIIDENGWVSHDLGEIYSNTLLAVRDVVQKTGIDKEKIEAVGISNQRETTAIWDRSGMPLAPAVVWQCSRAEAIAKRFEREGRLIYEKTGLPLSPYFPASKMRWLLEHVEHNGEFCLGTMDSWLVYRLTGNQEFRTDVSNASRTQLFNLETLSWDEELCRLFAIPMEALAKICDSNEAFGYTDFDGYLEHKIPIHGVMGDSHAALFGQGCHRSGMAKATYGTGSSIMMNTGEKRIHSTHGLATSLAWSMNGQVHYVLEGNINYTGAVISWLVDNVRLIGSPAELAGCVRGANPQDQTVLIPAFSGLGAPHWNSEAKAMIYGMTRTTGKNEIVKAAVESIAYQVADVMKAMKEDSGELPATLRVDGGPTKNDYLMQFQSDIAGTQIAVSKQEELSAIGAAYMAGMAIGMYQAEIFDNLEYTDYNPGMAEGMRAECWDRWNEAIGLVTGK